MKRRPLRFFFQTHFTSYIDHCNVYESVLIPFFVRIHPKEEATISERHTTKKRTEEKKTPNVSAPTLAYTNCVHGLDGWSDGYKNEYTIK